MSTCKRPDVEALESREMPAQHFIIVDFTPNVSIGAQTLRAFVNTLPPLPDGRGAGWAKAVIVNRMKTLVEPFGSKVIEGEGKEWLARGIKDPHLLVTVINIGGFSAGDSSFGMVAQQAPVGKNIEGNGWVFSASVVNWGWEGRAFCNTVAATAVHEVGHLLGLGHNTPSSSLSLMNSIVNTRLDAVIEETPRPMIQYRGDGTRFITPISAAREWRASLNQPSTRGF